MILCGIDRLLAQAHRLAGRPYGLLGHTAAVTRDLVPTHMALASSAAGKPAALFGPEHGYYAVEQDMVASADERDPFTGAPIASLYGDAEHSLKPRPDAFRGLEVLLIDLQDIGTRYYTFAATAVWAAEAALEAGLEVWLLDRPNPLGGTIHEGNAIEDGYTSFVGALDLPVRHGLSLGEILRLEGKRRGWPAAKLEVFLVKGWKRRMSWPEVGRPWIAPSPNMPSYGAALVYPGGCLIEATEISEGRGTTRPFELVGAPGLDPLALSRALGELLLPGVKFLPTFFKPQFQKHAGKVCGGVQLVVGDPAAFRSYRTGIEMLRLIKEQLGPAFSWRVAPYEFVSDRAAIDLLTGSSELRQALETADRNQAAERLEAFYRKFRADEDRFSVERRDILLYD
jgi:uncharacterized protein YbbC (DUF1343 family)